MKPSTMDPSTMKPYAPQASRSLTLCIITPFAKPFGPSLKGVYEHSTCTHGTTSSTPILTDWKITPLEPYSLPNFKLDKVRISLLVSALADTVEEAESKRVTRAFDGASETARVAVNGPICMAFPHHSCVTTAFPYHSPQIPRLFASGVGVYTLVCAVTHSVAYRIADILPSNAIAGLIPAQLWVLSVSVNCMLLPI